MEIIRLDTLGRFIDNDHTLAANCRKCGHYAKLDLEALAQRLGRDHSTNNLRLRSKLKCSKCGSKDIALLVSTITADRSTM